MSYLHLPEEHSQSDLRLAGQVAEAFESEELYIAWTHDGGSGARPALQAHVRDAHAHPFVEAITVLVCALADVWRAIVRPASGVPARQRQAA